jgi:hypothetical protein
MSSHFALAVVTLLKSDVAPCPESASAGSPSSSNVARHALCLRELAFESPQRARRRWRISKPGVIHTTHCPTKAVSISGRTCLMRPREATGTIRSERSPPGGKAEGGLKNCFRNFEQHPHGKDAADSYSYGQNYGARHCAVRQCIVVFHRPSHAQFVNVSRTLPASQSFGPKSSAARKIASIAMGTAMTVRYFMPVMVMSPHALAPSAGTLVPRIRELLRRGNWNRRKTRFNSARSWLARVFTQSGSFPEVGRRPSQVRSRLNSRHAATASACRFRATSGSDACRRKALSCATYPSVEPFPPLQYCSDLAQGRPCRPTEPFPTDQGL